ncbi:MAG: alpha/beta hydrolase [Sphingomicrobium sp.]
MAPAYALTIGGRIPWSAPRVPRGMIRSLLAPLLALSACSPPALLTGLDRLTPGGDSRQVASGVAFTPALKLDVYAPARARSGAALPVVIFYYGGGWVGGSRGGYGFAGSAYASKGFVTVVPDYRLVPGVRFPTFVEDSAQAVRWTRDNIARFGGDPRRINLAGHSAGAYNAAMIALDGHYLKDIGVDPKIVRSAALLSGPYDFLPFDEQRGRDALGAWPRPLETQPIHFASAAAPPMLLATGNADDIVRPRNSEALAARLGALGVPVVLKLYPGKSHVDLAKSLSKPFRGTTPALADSAAFMADHSR